MQSMNRVSMKGILSLAVILLLLTILSDKSAKAAYAAPIYNKLVSSEIMPKLMSARIRALSEQSAMVSAMMVRSQNDTQVKKEIEDDNSAVSARRSPLDDGKLSLGDRGSIVSSMQERLKALNYYPFQVDGIYGSRTKEAVKRFQAVNGLSVDGIIGGKTRTALLSDDAQSAAVGVQHETAASVSGDNKSKTQTVKQTDENKHAESSSLSALVDYAKNFLGSPYAWGGTSPGGFDCSGYVQYVFAHFGYDLPRTTARLWAAGSAVDSLAPGDLVFYETYQSGPSHVGIYIGGASFIHASSSHGVEITNMSQAYWSSRYLGAKSVFQ
ncbi:MAG TPA: NlpC/P60 family protein [Bacillales bacterium]|nr:NlpC/P60 family protein [Bacillales bacterium]